MMGEKKKIDYENWYTRVQQVSTLASRFRVTLRTLGVYALPYAKVRVLGEYLRNYCSLKVDEKSEYYDHCEQRSL